MAAHRYWRAIGLEAYGFAGLELTEFHLLAGTTRVDASATLTSSIAPATGSLANLKDDDTATGAAWSTVDLRTLVLSWDFGSDVDITDIRLGAATDPARFLMNVAIQYSDDAATWTTAFVVSGATWPGVRSKTVSVDPTGLWSPTDKWSTVTISSDRTQISTTEATAGRAQVGQSAGVKQFEVTPVFSGGTLLIGAGLSSMGLTNISGAGTGNVLYYNSGAKRALGASGAFSSAYASGTVVGVVVDFTAGSLTFYRNGVSAGVAQTSGLVGPLFPVAGTDSGGASATFALKGRGLAFPIAGASEWAGVVRILQGTSARVATATMVPSAASIPYSYGTTRTRDPVRGRTDFVSGVLGQGVGRVKGTTKDKGTPNVPVSERVRLYRERDGLLMRETWSTPGTGAYSFDYVDEMQSYTVISCDHDKNFRAVVADGLNLANGGVEVIA